MLPLPNLFNVLKRAGKEFGQDEGSSYAAATAFAAFASLFPLILFMVSLASFFLDPKSAQDFVVSRLPEINASASPTDQNFLATTVRDIIEARGPVTGIAAFIGLISLVFSASGMFAALQTAINRAWDCEKAGSLIRDKLIAIGMALGVVVVLVASTVTSALLHGIQEGATGLIGQLPWLWNIVSLLVTIGLATGVLSVLYRTMPRCKVNWADVWPGALLIAVGFELLKQLFAFYLGNFANYQAVYGTLGAVIALQTYILLICTLLVFGAEFCAEYAGERMRMEAEAATARIQNKARDIRIAGERRVEELRIAAGRRAEERVTRRAANPPPGTAAPVEHGRVLGAAAAAALALGLLGKLIGGRGARG